MIRKERRNNPQKDQEEEDDSVSMDSSFSDSDPSGDDIDDLMEEERLFKKLKKR